VTSLTLAAEASNSSSEGAGATRKTSSALRKMISPPPLSGGEHSLRKDEVTTRILRVAFLGMLSLIALVMFVLAFLKTFENLQ